MEQLIHLLVGFTMGLLTVGTLLILAGFIFDQFTKGN